RPKLTKAPLSFRLKEEIFLRSLAFADVRRPSLVTQPRGYFLDENIFVDGLGYVADAAGSQRLLPITFHRIRSNGDYWNISRGRLRFYSSGDFKPVHSGKLDIHHNQIGALFF